MPWSVAPLRLGRSWVMAPDARSLRARWDALTGAEPVERARLFGPSRARGLGTAVAALPGQRTGTGRLAGEGGPCPEPVRVLHGAFDEQWLVPDHRLIDVARPELWRVVDGTRQLFVVEQGYVAGTGTGGPALTVTAHVPDGRSPAGRPGRIRPLYRRPGGVEPNVTPGLLAFLSGRYGTEVGAAEFLAWTVAAARPSPAGCRVPLTASRDVWRAGVELGERLLRVHLRGARGGERPRLPGGRRPYVRSAVPARPGELAYDAESETLLVGEGGRISPVPAEAWEFEAGGVRVLDLWFARRVQEPPDALSAIRPSAWPQEWTSELLELITQLALLAAARGEREAVLGDAATIPPGEVPVPGAGARRPASVLDHEEEGPNGQFALL
ncbi:type ISP restriction/modification enzyme [Streptomyces sp. NPDC050504]|uniref:type ISP restriction/modification enzyme n=1 Tax=Streptomyces sp. NPDC050504 TaxID=3365618 RepID=UPI00378B98BB